MSFLKSAEGYHAIVDLIQREPDSCICWQRLLSLTKQPGIIQRLTAIDVGAEITAVAHQLATIWSHEPVPREATFLYFGLYDLSDEKLPRGRVRLYLSGGSSPNPVEELTAGCTLLYLPKNGCLKCELLEQIRIAETELPEQADVLDYAVMLGGAAITVKGAIKVRGVSLPVYVGFDAGDFLLVSPQP
jgi:hypothetical protein